MALTQTQWAVFKGDNLVEMYATEEEAKAAQAAFDNFSGVIQVVLVK